MLGCIADDFTGATDLASTLAVGGMRVVLTIGVPKQPIQHAVDAIVVSLKTRTVSPQEAVAQSLDAARWLNQSGASQIYFKYCSTFDSTPSGNIGPVIEALMELLRCEFTVACPAFPDNGRRVFQGHLFVGHQLLSESGMRDHPLTPMRDSNLQRVLQAQTSLQVGLVEHDIVSQGPHAISEAIQLLKATGVGIAIMDAVSNAQLRQSGPAWHAFSLLTGASGLAQGLPGNFGCSPNRSSSDIPVVTGPAAIVSGSCSLATNAQVQHFLARGGEGYAVNPSRVVAGEPVLAEALQWAAARVVREPVLIFATASAQDVRAAQESFGRERLGTLLEATLSQIACGLVNLGVRRLIVAGGETSGAVTQALGVLQLSIGDAIAPGVPWCHAETPMARAGGINLALKSGNFGHPDFFGHAFRVLDAAAMAAMN